MITQLAESDNFKVTSEYEYVTLHFKSSFSRKSVYIGDFYGDPECAIISKNEKYIVMAGCGLIIYRLNEPFTEYGNQTNPNQYFEFFREPDNIWWISDLHQTDMDSDWSYFRFTAANNNGESIYIMNSENFEIKRIEP